MENILFPKISTIEQFFLSLGPRRTQRFTDGSTPDHTHPPLSPAGSNGRFESVIKGPTHAPSAQPWNQVSIAPHTQGPLRSAYEPPELGPGVPPRCPTAGMSVVPLVPLVRYLGAWLALPNPSHWLLRTIRLGYAIQFAQCPPKVRGIHFTSVKTADAYVLCAEFAVLLAKDAIAQRISFLSLSSLARHVTRVSYSVNKQFFLPVEIASCSCLPCCCL